MPYPSLGDVNESFDSRPNINLIKINITLAILPIFSTIKFGNAIIIIDEQTIETRYMPFYRYFLRYYYIV